MVKNSLEIFKTRCLIGLVYHQFLIIINFLYQLEISKTNRNYLVEENKLVNRPLVFAGYRQEGLLESAAPRGNQRGGC